MSISPFHALYKLRTLSGFAFGQDRLIPVFASSDMRVYPYQIAAAEFSMRSPYLKGAVLCDEGSLGKSYEAMLVIAQSYYEGKDNIILIVPTPLLSQWTSLIGSSFSMPYYTIDSEETFAVLAKTEQMNPFIQDGIIITTYDFAVCKAEYIAQINWKLSVFDEAHRLRKIYTDENKESNILRSAVGDSFKLLLTATPMQNDIMDLYGLIYFIDDTVFPDSDAFYKRYFRQPDNYPELAQRVSKYCFRTTRAQVKSYVKIPRRLPVTISYTPTAKEQRLYELLEIYLKKAEKLAYPKMDNYDLTLLLCRTLSSSTFAFSKTLSAAMKRIDEKSDEYDELSEMLTLCEFITDNAKGKELITALKTGFTQLKKNGSNQKAIIFTENKATQKYLYDLLGGKYKTLTYSGDKSRDYSIMQKFREDVQILITTDAASEGFNLEFCSYVINYDLPYNTLTLEQRINRCHRQEQSSDVVVLSFLNKNNFADVRMLELINKRVLQFDGIIGLSDDVIGNFDKSAADIFAATRTKAEIERTFNETLQQYEVENKQAVETAEERLFTSFSKNISDSVTITPQYIKDKTKEINDDLWLLTKYFFEGKSGFTLDDNTRTLRTHIDMPKVFTGARLGRSEYSMSQDYRPASGRHTIIGSLAKNIIKEILWQGIPDTGTVKVAGKAENCTLGFYEINVKPKSAFYSGHSYYVFTGRTANGAVMSDADCRKIMDLPVVSFVANGDTYGGRDGLKEKRHYTLDDDINAYEYLQKTITESESAEKEEIERLKQQSVYRKTALDGKLDDLRFMIKNAMDNAEKPKSRLEKLTAEKGLASLKRDLKIAEQNLFMDGLKIESQLEKDIKSLLDSAQLTATVTRQFIIKVESY